MKTSNNPKSLNEAIINLYLNLKIRKQDEVLKNKTFPLNYI